MTLLELMTVVIVITILLVMLVPIVPNLLARGQKAKCVGNLRSLGAAANLYVQDNQHWPQIAGHGLQDQTAAKAWIAAFAPYGLAQINWACPTIQRAMNSPDLTQPENVRVDYMGMPFGAKPNAPFQHSKQPWFIETADVHGNGQEVIFPDGHIEEAYDIFRTVRASGGSTH